MTPLVRLMGYAKPYRLVIGMASLCTALSTLLDLLPDILIGIAVDVVLKQKQSLLARYGIVDVKLQLIVLGLAACVTWALEAIFEYAYAYLWKNFSQSVQHTIRCDAYQHTQHLSMSYYQDSNTGTILSILNDDINQLERFLDVGIYKFVYFITTILAVGVTFLYLAPSVALYAFLPMPFILTAVAYFKHHLAPLYMNIRTQVSALANRIANNIAGIATIKSYASEEYELARVRVDSAAYKVANRAAITLSAAFVPLVRMVVVVAFTATVILGGWQALEGFLDVGAYSVLVFQTQRLLCPAGELADMIDLYERAMASINRIFGLMDAPVDTPSGKERLELSSFTGHIQFNAVSFGYDVHVPVLHNLNVVIRSGQKVAFVGSTGSGKSTLIKLLLRFYEVSSGSITLDGRDVKTLYTKDIRAAISLVSQEVFLFQGSVRDNIAYGTFNASLEAIIHVAKIAQAHDFIMNLAQGYDTCIGERGQKLSGGQRQRISIARALLKNAPIIVFDEATSSVDNETEAALQSSLETITTHQTVIIIAHRLSTICNADIIYVLNNGLIVESGNHEELIDKKGKYCSLWHVQTGYKDSQLHGQIYQNKILERELL